MNTEINFAFDPTQIKSFIKKSKNWELPELFHKKMLVIFKLAEERVFDENNNPKGKLNKY